MPATSITLYCTDCLTTFSDNEHACPNLGCARVQPPSGWGQMYGPGDVIDRTYRVSRRLALGGAGVTYLVRALGDDDEEIGPWIALKLLFASRDHGAYLRRLSTEAAILQELHHPNIVAYLGFVHRTGQSPYLLTQFEEGGSLLDHMKRVGTMSVRLAASVGRQVCVALEKGHAKGITHRDLKPENLLLRQITSKGEVPEIRVADFGIARVTGGLGAGLTRAGAFLGTPQYAAPEQFLGEPASDKADVYSLGAMMVFMMTARPLVQKAHTLAPEDVYTQLLDVIPPRIGRKSDSAEDCAAMNRILAAAMALDPAERCSVSALGQLLATLLDGQRTPDGADQNEAPPFIDLSDLSEATVLSTNHSGLHAMPTPTVKDSATMDAVLAGIPTVLPPEVGPPKKSSASWLFLAGGISVILAASVLGGLVVYTPWYLDGLPGFGERPIDAVSTRSLGVSARKSALLASKRGRVDIRKACPDARGKSIAIEVVVERDGVIRWAGPLEGSVAGAQCAAKKLEGMKSGGRLKQATKVRLKIRP